MYLRYKRQILESFNFRNNFTASNFFLIHLFFFFFLIFPFSNSLAQDVDIVAGKSLFNTNCAACHKLFEQGGQIGPDLSTYQRDDIDTMLLHIVNPSAEIREGYENFLLTTKDGRTVVGFLVEQDNQTVVLRGLDGQDISLERKDIKAMNAQGVSLMPAGLLTGYTDDQVRDLMAYLRSTQPLNN